MPTADNPEKLRLNEDKNRDKNWKRWGFYLAERQWSTVREDYSPDGNCWDHFPHDHARSRAYRWGEDGLLGLTDRQCRLCFAVTLWNEKDPILKERLFGLTNEQGNHGEDCKELYYYLDATPTCSYGKALYKYPQREFPYQQLIRENARLGRDRKEFELLDTGIFDEDRYFDIFAEYAKNSPNDILIRLTIHNRGPEAAPLHVLPTFWFRNTWIWGCEHEGCTLKPLITESSENTLQTEHESLGVFYAYADTASTGVRPAFLFTENESNARRLWQVDAYTPYAKDAFHEYVIRQQHEAVNPAKTGTKAAAHYKLTIPAGGSVIIDLRLAAQAESPPAPFGEPFAQIFTRRQQEAGRFYDEIISNKLNKDEKLLQRQAYAGLIWTKQFYHYSVRDWLHGDRDIAIPPASRYDIRNTNWGHLFNRDVISMPDKWEYPWYAVWDLAFHMIPFAHIDAEFTKKQLILLLREWYLHPNGQLPAYEFAFDDVNPPVHAWACWRVYKITAPRGSRDVAFLERVFHKLMINFTWWVNRKDLDGNNLFSGGFLGLDNIGVFDRSKGLPAGAELSQADGTAWMAFYCLTMLSIALELADENPVYEDVASKFFEHFVAIADAINAFGGTGLWHDADGFYYDQLQHDHQSIPMKIRSIVGLIPLLAMEILHADHLKQLPSFTKRLNWFLKHRKDLTRNIALMQGCPHGTDHRLVAIPNRDKLERVLMCVFDEDEFLSPYGIRSLSKRHEKEPYVFSTLDGDYTVRYTPGESDTGQFGGNSNWRGPIWFPINFLIIEALEKYHHFYQDSFMLEYPTGSGQRRNLKQIANDITRRLSRLFLPDENGVRPCHGPERIYRDNPHFNNLILFYEYFHGDNGRGCGASHQTGWTALVAKLLHDLK